MYRVKYSVSVLFTLTNNQFNIQQQFARLIRRNIFSNMINSSVKNICGLSISLSNYHCKPLLR